MGVIQNSINQIFTSALGAGIAVQHSPYMKTKELRNTQAARRERLTQLEQATAKGEAQPDISVGLPIGGKETQYEKITPERELELVKKIQEYEALGNPEIEARIEKETKQAAKTYAPYFQEMKEVAEAYNIGAAKLGEERLDLAEITTKEQDLARQIKESLQKAYTTKEGILNTAQMRREYLKALRDTKKEANNGK